MTHRTQFTGRETNEERIKFPIYDAEHTATYSPNSYHGSRFFGGYSKMYSLEELLSYEEKEKYHNEYAARFKSKLEIENVPRCFGKCVNDVERQGGLNPEEKNCMRECFLRRLSAKDDMYLLILQKNALDTMKDLRATYLI